MSEPMDLDSGAEESRGIKRKAEDEPSEEVTAPRRIKVSFRRSFSITYLILIMI